MLAVRPTKPAERLAGLAAPDSVERFLADVLVEGAMDSRRDLKHGEQYTGRAWVGRKGTVVGLPQLAQTVWCLLLGAPGPGRVDKDLKDMGKRTPSPNGTIRII